MKSQVVSSKLDFSAFASIPIELYYVVLYLYKFVSKIINNLFLIS